MISEKAFYQRYLKDEFARRCDRNPSYSLRAFARALGLTPSALSEILSEKRIPSYKLAQRILGALAPSPEEEREFLASLASGHRSRGLKRLNPIFKQMGAPKGERPPELSIELFRVIGDWYHYAILTLTRVEGFKPDPRWIARSLGISPAEAKLALERLLELELLREHEGKLEPFEEHFTTADKSLTTAALKRHQKQILEKAIHSLENDPIEARSMSSMTMAVDSARIPEAKRRIEAFTHELCAYLEGGRKNQVFELGICLYPLQKKENLK